MINRKIGQGMPTNHPLAGLYGRPGGLTDILYQRDREIIAFVRPDLAVSGTGSLSVAQAVGIQAMSAA